jgi:hypothetical protein
MLGYVLRRKYLLAIVLIFAIIYTLIILNKKCMTKTDHMDIKTNNNIENKEINMNTKIANIDYQFSYLLNFIL